MRLSYKIHKVYKDHKAVRLLSVLCFMSFALLSYSQNVEFIKKNFKDNPKEYKKAADSIKKGNTYFNMGTHFYKYAISYYLSAESFNPNSALLNYRIGKCLIYSSMRSQASFYLTKAIKLNPAVAPDVHYYLGRALHLAMYWDSAKREYNTYLQTLVPAQVAEIANARKKMEECDNGKRLCQNPKRVFIDNLGAFGKY